MKQLPEAALVTRAQLTQERSRVRREQLLDACLALFAEGGARAVTHRAVATRAGLPPATTVYYFASIDDLLREALRRHVQQWIATMEELAGLELVDLRRLLADADHATGLVSAVFALRDVATAGTELAIYLGAARDPALRADAADALGRAEDLVARLLTALGVPDAPEVAAGAVALILGSAVRRQAAVHPEPEEARLLAHALRRLLAASLEGAVSPPD
jgi:TetR/AcrR family transcriptional regulator, regulator of biofilm formation and stress response